MNEIASPVVGGPGEIFPAKILMCPDQVGWAFDNIANNIEASIPSDRIKKIYMGDVIGNEEYFFRTIILKNIDICHVFWREDLFYLLNPHTIAKSALKLGLDYEGLVRAINSCAFTTSVYDHLFSDLSDIQARAEGFSLVDGYTVSSNRLKSIYETIPGIPPPDAVITDGVDTRLFCPDDRPRQTSSPFTIGWAGNSAWGRQSQGRDIKGYDRLYLPVMQELTRLGMAVRPSIADPQVRRIPFQEMPDFYRGLDVFTCTSLMEGTPNTVLEAMACGIPVVSTDVGVVSDIFGPLQRRFLIANPDAGSFANAIATLLNDPELRLRIAEENRARAIEWSWLSKVREWPRFWRKVLTRTMDWRMANRREFLLLSHRDRFAD